MKISRIEIAGFGAMRDVVLELKSNAPVVLLHGPNEAGKSTLMQFIRAVLFGFQPRSQAAERYEPLYGATHGGALLLTLDDGRTVRVQRYDAPDAQGKRPSRGNVQVTLEDGAVGGEELLRRVIGDVTEDVYRNIYAFGLTELQELRTLQSDELNGYLFNAGLGVNGSAVLETEKRITAELDRLFRPRGKKQTINMLVEQLDELSLALRKSRSVLESYHVKQDELEKLRDQLSAAEHKLREAESRMLWHDKCLQSRPAWQELRAAELELNELPELDTFPKDGLRRFEEEKLRLTELQAMHDQLTAKMSNVVRQIGELAPNEHRLAHRKEIEELAEQAAMIRSLHDELRSAHVEDTQLTEQARQQIARIDDSWTEAHVAGLNASLAERSEIAGFRDRLAGLERQLEAVGADAARLQAEKQRLLQRRNEAADEVARTKEELRSHHAGRLGELAPDERRKLLHRLSKALQNWRQAAWESAAEERRQQELRQSGRRMRMLLIALAALTVVLPAVLFLVDDGLPAIIAAVVLLAADGVVLLMRRSQVADGGKSREHIAREMQRWSEETVALFTELTGEQPYVAAANPSSIAGRTSRSRSRQAEPEAAWSVEAAAAAYEQLELASDRWLSEEQNLRRLADRVSELERQLTDVSERLAEIAEEQAACRRAWEDEHGAWSTWLAERGLPPKLAPETALELFSLAEQAKQTLRQRDGVRARIASYQARIADYEEQVARLYARLAEPLPTGVEPEMDNAGYLAAGTATMADEHGLRGDMLHQELREHLTEEASASGRDEPRTGDSMEPAEYSEYEVGSVRRAKLVWKAADVAAGMPPGGRSAVELAKQLAELVAQDAELAERRQTLHRQWQEWREELERTADRIRQAEARIALLWQQAGASDETEFHQLAAHLERRQELQQSINRAISQLEWLVTPAKLDELMDSLNSLGGAELEAELANAKAAITTLNAQMEELRDQRAKLELELEKLKEGTEQAELEQRREELLAELNRSVAEYSVYAMASGLIRRTRQIYERERQPKVLQQASHYMSVITGGRYVRVLAPFGEQRLIVERDDGYQLDTSRLSRGTAEQLYLAMRFALVEAHASAQEALPLVLDDILVNFDEERAARCLDCLAQISSSRQVLMFTCHDYMRSLVSRQLPQAQVIGL